MYLSFQGHAEVAARLQKDWGIDPQTLPFASRIKPHALVALVSKGLQYHQVEQSLSQQGARNTSAAGLFFGIESERGSSLSNREQHDDNASSSPQHHKHPRRDPTVNGLGLSLPPSAKRARRGNASTNGDSANIENVDHQNGYHYQHRDPPEPVSPTNYSTADDGNNPMDIDEDAPTSPSPNDQLIVTLTHGRSIEVQSEKVAELGPHTSILTVPEKIHVQSWNPKDPNLLAIAGDALCRIWTVSKKEALADYQSFVDILDPPTNSMVSTMTWSPNGDILAVAIRDDNSNMMGAVSLWSKAGKLIDELAATQDNVLTLRWSPSGQQLLGITYSGADTSSLVVWDINPTQAMPPPYQIHNVITDIAWLSNNQIIICGHNIIASSLLESGRILTLQHRTEPAVCHTWSHICYDSRTHTTALAAEDSGTLGLIDSSDTLRTIEAHNAEITALAYQPITNLSAYPASAPRLLATSSLDGTIIIWDAKHPFAKVHTLHLGSMMPAMAMSFTPDGYLVAVANENQVLIWNAEAGGVPKASWKGFLDKLPNGSSLTNGDRMDEDGANEGTEESYPTLGWDAECSKLALSSGNQIAIINFRP